MVVVLGGASRARAAEALVRMHGMRVERVSALSQRPGSEAMARALAAGGRDGRIGAIRGVLFTANIQTQIAALIIVCVTICVVRDRGERQLHQVRSVAEAAQRVLLQPLPTHAGPLRIAGLYIPADEEADLGGDLYAAARTDHHSTRLRIGDVRGNGLAAINNAALLLGAFRAAAYRQATLPRLAVHLDAAFRWDQPVAVTGLSRTPTRTSPP